MVVNYYCLTQAWIRRDELVGGLGVPGLAHEPRQLELQVYHPRRFLQLRGVPSYTAETYSHNYIIQPDQDN